MIRRPPRSTQSRSSAASDVYKRQEQVWFGHYHPAASLQFTSGQVVCEALGLSGKAGVRNIEHGCATGSVAMHDARLAVASGAYDVVMVAAGAKTCDSIQT